MFPGFIGKEIQRTNRNLLLLNAGLLSVPIVIGVLGWTYWGEFFGGAKLVASQDLIAAPDKYIGRYIKVVGTGSTELGIQEVTEKTDFVVMKSDDISARLITIDLGKIVDRHHSLLVKLKNDDPIANSAIGTLKSVPYYTIDAEVLSTIVTNSTLPVMIDSSSDFRTIGYVGLVVGVLSGLVGGFELSAWQERRRDITLHPLIKKLSTYGQAELVAQSIDRDLSTGNSIVFQKTKVTDTWLLQQGRYVLELAKLADLVWIHLQVTSHRLNGVIPICKSYAAICYDRDGTKIEMPGKKAQVTKLLEQLELRVPWAIVGHSDEIKLAWEKERNDFIAVVDEQRQKI
jgi:Putative transmembrane protein precursor